MSLSSLGSVIQTLNSPDNFDSVGGRNSDALRSLSGEALSAEGSGQDVDRAAARRLISQTVTAKEAEQAGDGEHSAPEITLAATPALPLQHSGADRANTSITGHTRANVHIISEEALSHITAEGQYKENRASKVNDDFLNGE